MPFGWHSAGLEMDLGEDGSGASGKEEEMEPATGLLHRCEGSEGLLWFNLCSRTGQTAEEGTEEETGCQTEASH